MRADVKQWWIEALESGEYKQGSGNLRIRAGRENAPDDGQSEGWCCLGVLCDIYHKITGEGSWSSNEEARSVAFHTRYVADDGELVEDRSAHYLPTVVAQWAGLGGTNPIPRWEEGERPDQTTDPKDVSYAHLNDKGWSFQAIASIVRREPEVE